MNRELLCILITFTAMIVNAQQKEINELQRHFKLNDYHATQLLADSFLLKYPNSPEINLLMGMAKAESENYFEALPYFEKVTYGKFNNSDTTRSWALGYMGCCSFMLEGPDEAEKLFERAYKSNGTINTEKFINGKLLLLGIDDEYEDWTEVKSEHINFWFEDTTKLKINLFIEKHELAYKAINSFFRAQLPKRIDFFVWNSIEDAQEILLTIPAFASPYYCCIHSNPNQSTGHELAHVLSHFAVDNNIKNTFIYEGIAVDFDQSQKNKEAFVKAYIKGNKIKNFSIQSVWKNPLDYPNEIIYPLGGIVVERLIGTFGRDLFIEFLKDQSYINATRIFGKPIEELIRQIERELY